MPTDLPGIPGARVSPPTPAPSATAPLSRALIPVAPLPPVEPRPEIGAAPRTPFDRSGISLLDVLTDADQVLARGSVAPVELEVGLEQARSSLLRQLPTEALASLDQVWQGAQDTEEGWYLRTGALLVLGLPGEGDRVATEGLDAQPASLALRFARSLARLAMGDVTGARQLLQGLPDEHDELLTARHARI